MINMVIVGSHHLNMGSWPTLPLRKKLKPKHLTNRPLTTISSTQTVKIPVLCYLNTLPMCVQMDTTNAALQPTPPSPFTMFQRFKQPSLCTILFTRVFPLLQICKRHFKMVNHGQQNNLLIVP